MTSSQVGKTEIINNIAAYFIDQDPSPILLVQPTLLIGEAWSKDRLTPMVRDTPALSNLIKTERKRDGENTILHKKFPGGHITVAGANSPASLSSRPIRIVLLDEVDRYPFSAGVEGDPVNLARARAKNFWNRKIVMSSTPTIKGESRIDAAYESSDQRKFYVPCPHCDEMQVLTWAQIQWDDGKPEDAVYICPHCGVVLTNGDKPFMLKNGLWLADKEFHGTAGFYLNELYSPWVSWGEIALNFLEAKKLPETLKTFINTSLAECWEEDADAEGLDEDSLQSRVEDYDTAPEGVLVITVGVDIQDDRIELEIQGWGVDEEFWSIDYVVLHGSPSKREVWQSLDDILLSKIPHALGVDLPISCVCIDSGGHHTEEVYQYCKEKARQKRRIYAIKGQSQYGKPVVGKFTRNNALRVKLFPLGVDTAKEVIFGRLKIEEPGAGFCHHPSRYDEEFFKQLTSEKQVKRFHKGRTRKEWIKTYRRNEVLDCRVYGMAALKILKPDFEKIAERLHSRITKLDSTGEEESVDNKSKPRKRPHSRPQGGFVNSWK